MSPVLLFQDKNKCPALKIGVQRSKLSVALTDDHVKGKEYPGCYFLYLFTPLTSSISHAVGSGSEIYFKVMLHKLCVITLILLVPIHLL